MSLPQNYIGNGKFADEILGIKVPARYDFIVSVGETNYRCHHIIMAAATLFDFPESPPAGIVLRLDNDKAPQDDGFEYCYRYLYQSFQTTAFQVPPNRLMATALCADFLGLTALVEDIAVKISQQWNTIELVRDGLHLANRYSSEILQKWPHVRKSIAEILVNKWDYFPRCISPPAPGEEEPANSKRVFLPSCVVSAMLDVDEAFRKNDIGRFVIQYCGQAAEGTMDGVNICQEDIARIAVKLSKRVWYLQSL